MKKNFDSFFLSLTIAAAIVGTKANADDNSGLHGFETPAPAAFALLGVTPSKIVEPASGQDLVGAILNGFDENGNFQNGYALEGRPYQWISGRDFVNDGDSLSKNLYRIKISFATTKGISDEDEAIRYGLGVNYSYNWNDFVNVKPSAYLNCSRNSKIKYQEFFKLSLREQDQKKAEGEKLRESVINDAQGCYKALKTWALTSISVGGAVHHAEAENENLTESGAGVWVTGTYSFPIRMLTKSTDIYNDYSADNAELAVHGRAVRGELSVLEDKLQDSDRDIIAARFRIGTADLGLSASFQTTMNVRCRAERIICFGQSELNGKFLKKFG